MSPQPRKAAALLGACLASLALGSILGWASARAETSAAFVEEGDGHFAAEYEPDEDLDFEDDDPA